MGCTDRPEREVDPKYVDAATELAERIFPDAYTIPGGEDVRQERNQNREDIGRLGPLILEFLDQQGSIDLTKL